MNQGNPVIGRPGYKGRAHLDGLIGSGRREIRRLEKELADARNRVQTLLLERYNATHRAQEFMDEKYPGLNPQSRSQVPGERS